MRMKLLAAVPKTGVESVRAEWHWVDDQCVTLLYSTQPPVCDAGHYVPEWRPTIVRGADGAIMPTRPRCVTCGRLVDAAVSVEHGWPTGDALTDAAYEARWQADAIKWDVVEGCAAAVAAVAHAAAEAVRDGTLALDDLPAPPYADELEPADYGRGPSACASLTHTSAA